jgi:MoaA/NifB/PqqE/SkfB family radical SAM enzyme
MNYIYGGERFLKCEVGTESCFIDPNGDVLACNGMNIKVSMGNIKEQTFDEIWNSKRAAEVRDMVKSCQKQCWMVGNAVPVIKKYLHKPAAWVMKNKIRVALNKKPILCFPDKKS